MVQISTAVLIATMAIAPVLAAPVTEPRRKSGRNPGPKVTAKFSSNIQSTSNSQTETTVSPPHFETENIIEARGKFSGLKKAAKVGGAVASGVGTAATIASIIQPQQRELSFEEFLEARGRFGGFKKAAKFGGSIASGVGTAATIGSMIQGRDLGVEEALDLEARGKMHGFKKAARVGGTVASGLGTAATIGSMVQTQERDLGAEEYLEARGKLSGFKKVAKVGGHVASGLGTAATVGSLLQSQGQERRSDELEERAIRLSATQVNNALSLAKKIGGAAAGGISLGAAVAPVFAPHKERRDIVDTEMNLESRRLPISGAAIGKVATAVAGAAGFGGIIAALDTKKQRDLSDIEAREPAFENYIRDVLPSLDELD